MNELVVGQMPAHRQVIRIPHKLRDRHGYVLGKSGKGKSTLLARLIHQDTSGSYATIVFDAGDLAQDVYEALPAKRLHRVLYFSIEHPIPYNPFLRRRDDPARLENELFALIDQVTAEASRTTAELSARMKRVLAAAMEAPAFRSEPEPNFSSLVAYLFSHRSELCRTVQLQADDFAITWESLIDRLSQFIRDPRIRRVVSNGHALDFDRVIDEDRILLISLAGLEPQLKRFLGTLLFHGLQSTILERPRSRRRPVAVYVDEFHDYVASSAAVGNFQTLFSQARKYGAGVTVAHTDFGQVPEALRETILGAGTLLTFSSGAKEAAVMSANFADEWPPQALVRLADHQAVVKVDDTIYLVETLPPLMKVRRYEETPFAGEDPPDPFAISMPSNERDPYTSIRAPRPARAA